MLSENEFFNKIYSKGFDDSTINQLLKLYADGYDLSYIDRTTQTSKLRQLRERLNKSDSNTQTAYKNEISSQKDILKFIDGDYNSNQIYLINKMEDEYADITPLLNPEYSEKQFNFLVDGMEEGIDVSWFADPKISEKNMEIFLRAAKHDINLKEFAKDYNNEQLEVILAAKVKKIDTKFLEDPLLSYRQMLVLVRAKEELNINLLDFATHNTNEYNLLMLMQIAKKNKSILFKIKDNCENFNKGQLAIINYYLEKNKDISEILIPEYSTEKMKLIMESNGIVKENIKKSKASDLNLHLYKYGFLENPSNTYSNIDEVNIIVRKDFKPTKLNLFETNNSLECIRQSYYMNNKEILEIERVPAKAQDDEKYTNLGIFNISDFGPYEINKILSKNENKISEFLNKYFLMEYNTTNDKLRITSLIDGGIKEYESPDMKLLNSYSRISSFFSSRFNNIDMSYDNEYANKEIIVELFKVFDFFNKLDIDPNDYYIIEDVRDDVGDLYCKLCIDKEDIDKKSSSDNWAQFAEFELKNTRDHLEANLDGTKYKMNFYDKDGIILDDYDELYTRRMINEMLNCEYSDFEYFGEFKSIDSCLDAVKKEESYWNEELR